MPKKKKTSDPRIKGLGLFLRRGNYHYQPPMVGGIRPNPFALKTADLLEAMNLRQAILDQEFVKQQTKPLAQLTEAFIADKSRSGKHRGVTSNITRCRMNRVVEYFKMSAEQISGKHLLQWRDDMLAERGMIKVLGADGKPTGQTVQGSEPNLSRASVKSYMLSAQAFCTWMKMKGHIYRNPFDLLPEGSFPQDVPTRRDVVCTKEQRDLILSSCKHYDLLPVLYLGFHAGLRRAEILATRPHWLQRDEQGTTRFIHVQNEKGTDGTQPFMIKDSEPKKIPVNLPLAEFLSHYGRMHHPYLVRPQKRHGQSLYRWEWRKPFTAHMESVGMPWVTPHVMRHTFISLLFSASTNSPSMLQMERWTGTAAATLNKNYAHIFEDFDRINAAN